MKSILLATATCFLLSIATAQADLTTPFSYTTSFDGNNALLYKAFNSFFDLKGSNALTGNQQLYETYAIDNPGTIMADQAKVYGLGGYYGEKSTFTIFGDSDTSSNVLYKSNPFPSTNNIHEFYNSTALFDDDSYLGALNFKIENSNGIFYSDPESFDNINRQNGANGQGADADINHFLFFDVTALMQEVYGDLLDFDFTSAYLVGYEDRAYIQSGKINPNWDGDYNDGLFLVFNNDSTHATPEPGTVLIFGAALIGLPLARRFRKK